MLLFLLFDFGAVALNFWLSLRIEAGTVAINLAGRQRMLSQEMAKVILHLDEAQRLGQDVTPLQQELWTAYELFDTTLRSFTQGVQTTDGEGRAVVLPQLPKGDAAALVARVQSLWAPYRAPLILASTAAPADLSRALIPLRTYAETDNLVVLQLMNALTSRVERATQDEASEIRVLLGLSFSLALVTLGASLWIYYRRMRDTWQQQDLLDEIINQVSASVMVLDTDGRTILKANHTMERMFGYPEGALVGQRVEDLVKREETGTLARRRDGVTFPVQTQRRVALWGNRPLHVETITDVTEQRQTEEHLTGLAYQDLLTGLPNRLLFDERLNAALTRARRQQARLGVLFIDLDGFKAVNDGHGHAVGDQLLQAVAARLRETLRDTDTVARRGGDEFTVLLPDIKVRTDCQRVAQHLLNQLAEPFTIEGGTLQIGGSIGIAVFPDDAAHADMLLARADAAMYRAKRQGRGTWCFDEADKA